MICITTQYFNLNRILLLIVGLWPYQQSKLVRLQVVLQFGILGSFIVFQLTTFMTMECTLDLILKVFSFTLVFATFIIKYNSFILNNKAVKCLLEQLQDIYDELQDENEVAIINKYGNSAKINMIALTLFIMSGLLGFICLPLLPLVLDILLPINESRPHLPLYIVTCYFIDQEKYFYLILLHMDIATCVGIFSIVATGTTLIGYIIHACGIFRVASYRIERAITKTILQDFSIEKETTAYKEIIYAVDIHCKALKYCEFLNSSFEGSFFFATAFGVTCMSINLYQIYRIMSFGNNIMEMLVHIGIIIGILAYMFLPNYFGQEIVNHNNHIFFTAYNVRWYIAPLHVQRQILFLLQRGSKEFTIGIGGVFIGNLKTFATLISTSVSYFTALYAIQ